MDAAEVHREGLEGLPKGESERERGSLREIKPGGGVLGGVLQRFDEGTGRIPKCEKDLGRSTERLSSDAKRCDVMQKEGFLPWHQLVSGQAV